MTGRLLCRCTTNISSLRSSNGSVVKVLLSCVQPKFFKGKYQGSLTTFNLPLQVATEREIARQQYSSAGQALSDWTVRLKAFPHPALSTNNIVGQVIGPFLFAASMFSYVPAVSLFPASLGNKCYPSPCIANTDSCHN